MLFNINGKPVEIGGQQATVLKKLMNTPHRIVTLDELVDAIGNSKLVRQDIQNVIAKLRIILRQHEVDFIETTYQVGYQWKPK